MASYFRPIAGSVLLLALICLAGCEHLQNQNLVSKPSISDYKVGIENINFEALTLNNRLLLSNPNPLSLPIKSISYKVNYNNNQLTGGQINPDTHLKAGAQTPVNFTTELKYTDLYRIASESSKQINVQLSGHLRLALPILEQIPIPFSLTKSLPMVKIPTLSVEGIKLKSLQLTNTTFDLLLKVNNGNHFDLGIPQMDYQFKVDNKSWFSASENRLPTVTAQSTKTIKLPVQINPMNIGISILGYLKAGKPLNYALDGNMQLLTSLQGFRKTAIPINKQGLLPVL